MMLRENKKIINVEDSKDLTSAVNKKYVDEKIILDPSKNNMLRRKEDGTLNVPKCLILGENYDVENKKIINLKAPTNSEDAVTNK